MNTLEIQTLLKQANYDPGPLDGIPGLRTDKAVRAFQKDHGLAADGIVGPKTEAALRQLVGKKPPARTIAVPPEWLSNVVMKGIVVHWTAGTYQVSELDTSHYHIIIDGAATLHRGVDIAKNAATGMAKDYAAHTRNHNTGIIGVSLACMGGAVESPFNAGKWPMKREQWDVLPGVLVDLCRFYRIPVTDKTVLSHAEVQKTLGIKQNGKWDISRLAFDPAIKGAQVIGDELRSEVARRLSSPL